MVSDPRHTIIADSVARHADSEQTAPSAIEWLYLAHRSTASEPILGTQWPCLALVAQGAKTLSLGSEIHRYGVGDYLLVSVDLPVVSRVTEASVEVPHLGLGMAIRPDRLQEAIARIAPHRLPSSEMLGVVVTKAPTELLDAIARLLLLMDNPGDIPVMAPLIEQEILCRLLQGPAGSRLLQIATMETPGNRIARSIGWLKANYARPLRIDRLAEDAGMSISSLHHHFKTVTAISPLQYQKLLRLQEARRLMLSERMDVGTAGYSVGYESASQFSREYKRLYGMAPGREVYGRRAA